MKIINRFIVFLMFCLMVAGTCQAAGSDDCVYVGSSTLDYARREMERCSGTQFDPIIAQKMISMIEDGFVYQIQG